MHDEELVSQNQGVVAEFFAELSHRGHEVKAADQTTAQLLEGTSVADEGEVERDYQHLEGRLVEMEYDGENYFVVMEYMNDGHSSSRLGGILEDERSAPQAFSVEYDRDRAINMADEL
ncbi:MAG: hypothetical protein ABEJ72_01910, partial [Candidatus Aenigmatarchaeota archaeon]